VRHGHSRPDGSAPRSPPEGSPGSSPSDTQGGGRSPEAASRIAQSKRRIDDILSKQVTTDSFAAAASGRRGGRARLGDNSELGRERASFEADVLRMQREMDSLRQRAALEELREEVGCQGEARRAEAAHATWLLQRKHQLQAMRVQKALSQEQRQFEDEMAALGMAAGPGGDYLSRGQQQQQPGQADQWKNPNAEGKPGNGPFELCVDGLTIPAGMELGGDELRFVLGFVAQDGAMLGRLLSSDWQPCSKAAQRGRGFKRASSELRKLGGGPGPGSDRAGSQGGGQGQGQEGNATVISKVGAAANVMAAGVGAPLSRRASPQEHELMQLSFRPGGDQQGQTQTQGQGQGPYSSQLRVMLEVQVRRGSHSTPKGAGWVTLDPSRPQWAAEGEQTQGQGQEAGGGVLPRGPRFGNWRASLRVGLADPCSLSTQTVLPGEESLELSAGNGMWALFRIARAGSVTGPNPVTTLLAQDAGGTACWAAFMDYQNYAAAPADGPAPPPLLRNDSAQSLQSVPSLATARPPSTAAPPAVLPSSSAGSGSRRGSTAGGGDPRSPNPKAGTGPGLAAGLGVLAAIHEMKAMRASHGEEEEEEGALSGFFELGTPTPPASAKYLKDDGVDVYVDGARFLPGNATVTRVVVKLLSADMEALPLSRQAGEGAISGGSEVDSDAACPVYNKKVECRAAVFNCTAVLLFRIDTLDAASLRGVGVGYAALKVMYRGRGGEGGEGGEGHWGEGHQSQSHCVCSVVRAAVLCVYKTNYYYYYY
jgi:hypothetical protein